YYETSNDFQILLGGFCIIIAIYIFSIYIRQDFLHPISIYSIFWLGVAGISTFRVSYYQVKWSLYMWIIIILAYITFVLGFKVFRIRKTNEVDDIKVVINNINVKKLYLVLKILVGLSYMSLLLEVVLLKYIPLFSSNMNSYRNFNVTGLHYFVILVGIIPPLAILYKKAGGRKKIWWIVALSFVVSILIVSRQLIIMQVVLIIIARHYFYKKIKLKQFVVIFLLGSILFSLSFSLRNQNSNYINNVAKIMPKYQNSIIVKPLLYFNMNFNNLNIIVNNFHDYKLGENMIFPILAFANIKDEINYSYKSEYLATRNFNTCTYLADIYYDFGIIGVIILPFILGLIYSRFYNIANKKISVYSVMYFLLAYCLIFCFFVNWYYNTAIVFDIVILLLIQQYVEKGKRVGEK
ncbi:MAG: O-antigen polymerase, partial [Clostridium sp.]|uniref:O-antigen polymerase n=1 Tax=Clostridium sp. TaxID=1506 RepID=UPI003F2A9EFA